MDLAQSAMGYMFRDKDILWEALNVAGSGDTIAGGRGFADGNKRLAILGDRVAETVMCSQWYPTGDDKGTARAFCVKFAS